MAGYTSSCDACRLYRLDRSDRQHRLSCRFSYSFDLVLRNRGATPCTRSRRYRRLCVGSPAGLLDTVRVLQDRPSGTGTRSDLRRGTRRRRNNNRDTSTGVFLCRNYSDRCTPAGRPPMAQYRHEPLGIIRGIRPSIACRCGALFTVGPGSPRMA